VINRGCPMSRRQKVAMREDRIDILEKVQFAPGSARIRPRSFAMLDQVVSVLKTHPDVARVQVEGHTDSTGGARLNTTLSQSRAESVVAYLATHGVERARLEARGFGPSRPLATNVTRTGREANRRVEFRVWNAARSWTPKSPRPPIGSHDGRAVKLTAAYRRRVAQNAMRSHLQSWHLFFSSASHLRPPEVHCDAISELGQAGRCGASGECAHPSSPRAVTRAKTIRMGRQSRGALRRRQRRKREGAPNGGDTMFLWCPRHGDAGGHHKNMVSPPLTPRPASRAPEPEARRLPRSPTLPRRPRPRPPASRPRCRGACTP